MIRQNSYCCLCVCKAATIHTAASDALGITNNFLGSTCAVRHSCCCTIVTTRAPGLLPHSHTVGAAVMGAAAMCSSAFTVVTNVLWIAHCQLPLHSHHCPPGGVGLAILVIESRLLHVYTSASHVVLSTHPLDETNYDKPPNAVRHCTNSFTSKIVHWQYHPSHLGCICTVIPTLLARLSPHQQNIKLTQCFSASKGSSLAALLCLQNVLV